MGLNMTAKNKIKIVKKAMKPSVKLRIGSVVSLITFAEEKDGRRKPQEIIYSYDYSVPTVDMRFTDRLNMKEDTPEELRT